MEIRKAIFSDVDEVYFLHTELKTNAFDKNKYNNLFKRELQDPHAYHLVAVDGQKIIGELAGKIEERLTHDRKVATIEGLIVSSGFRNRGIGKELFLAFEEIARKNDCEKIEVSSKITRVDAHRFYTDKVGMNKTHYRFSKYYS